MTSFRSNTVAHLLGQTHHMCHKSCRMVTSIQSGSIKSFDDIPSKKGFLPATWDLLKSGGPGYLHEHCDRRHAELGPIFREKLTNKQLVFIADTRLIQTVISNEGSRPHHNVPEAWTVYNEVKRIERGLFFQTGEPWIKLRRAFNKVMLADPKRITRFTKDILLINSDLFDLWKRPTKSSTPIALSDGSLIIPDTKFELCKWSIEATGLMLFGSRMGCISDSEHHSADSKADELVKHVANMFSETSKFQIIPCRLAQRLNMTSWRRFEQACDGMLSLANYYSAEFITKAKELRDNQSLVRDLLDLNSLKDVEISRSMVDLIIAAADTTSNSLQWMLYVLAKDQRVQSMIREEVVSLDENMDSFENIKQSCPYLTAYIKEVSRLYPTAPFLARTLDHPILLGEYQLPAGVPIVFSLYTTSRMSQYFEDPLVLRPERWLRFESESISSGTKTKTPNYAYATLPFGVGARMCIGRRLADLEMHLLIASLVLKFDISLEGEDDIQIKLNMILSPDKPIKLRLFPRSGT